MDDKKTNPNGSDNQDIDLLTKKAKEEKAEFGSAGHDDINKNLGSFGNTKVQAETEANEVKLDVDAKVVEKASKEKINFERFSKTKRTNKAAKTKFGEKVSIMLRSKKGLRTTWIVELVIMFVIIIISSILLAFLMRYWDVKGDGILANDAGVQRCIKTGVVFAWISIFPCVIPLIYLLTAWFVGINQVSSSRLFHYMFWIALIIAIVSFIVGFGLLMVPTSILIQYPAYAI